MPGYSFRRFFASLFDLCLARGGPVHQRGDAGTAEADFDDQADQGAVPTAEGEERPV